MDGNPDSVTVATELHRALQAAALEPRLFAVTTPSLVEAVAAYIRALLEDLSAHAGEPLRVAELVDNLGKVLESATVKALCNERYPFCTKLLADTLQRHPSDHDVQVNAQWVLAKLAGTARTLKAVEPIAGQSPTAVRAFYWTAAYIEEELLWPDRQHLVTDALGRIETHPTEATDVEMQMRCFQLIEKRLGMQGSAIGIDEQASIKAVARRTLPVLVQAIACWAGSPNDHCRATERAVRALWSMCFDENNLRLGLGQDAQLQLVELESKTQTLVKALWRLPGAALTLGSEGSVGSWLIQLLASGEGLRRLAQMLSERHIRQVGSEESLPSPELVRAILSEMQGYSDAHAHHVVEAVVAVLAAVGNESAKGSEEKVVKVLAALMEAAQSQLKMPDDPGTEQRVAEAIRQGVVGILQLLSRFREIKGGGRWPANTAVGLRTAATSDVVSRSEMQRSMELQEAAHERIKGACNRHDDNSYREIRSTLALLRTLWGSMHVLSILQDALENHGELDTRAFEWLVQAGCRVLADVDDDAPSVKEASLSVRMVLQLSDVSYEADRKMMGPMSQALGYALSVLASAPSLEARDVIHDGAKALVFFLERIPSELKNDGLLYSQEVCWGLCRASSGDGSLATEALVSAGAMRRLPDLIGNLAKHVQTSEVARVALADAIEGLGRLASLRHIVEVMRDSFEVRAAGLTALRNLLNDHQRNPPSREEAILIVTVLDDHVDNDEGFRNGAETVRGLLYQQLQGM